MEQYMWIVWLVLMLVMIFIEAMGPALVSIWFAAGALIALILSLFSFIPNVTVPWWLQLIVFVVVSTVTLLLMRPLSKRYFKRNVVNSNADSLLGKKGLLEEEVKPFLPGVCKINDVAWTAVSVDGKQTIAKGSVVEVVAIQGNKLIVKKVEEN